MDARAHHRPHEQFGECLACRYFGCSPSDLAIDLAGESPVESDRLCGVHRARATEGACVLCGNRFPWMRRRGGSEMGACRPCYSACFGEAAAEELEAAWAALNVALEL